MAEPVLKITLDDDDVDIDITYISHLMSSKSDPIVQQIGQTSLEMLKYLLGAETE